MNKAGLGPKTDNYYFGMNDAAPGDYPTEVTVMSHTGDSVRVQFRGVSSKYSEQWGHIEDPLAGYTTWVWDIREDIRNAEEQDFGRLETGIIRGLEKNVIYKLRVLPYNGGGYGTKSTELYFTLGGEVVYDPTTTIIRNAAPTVAAPSLLSLLLPLVALLRPVWGR